MQERNRTFLFIKQFTNGFEKSASLSAHQMAAQLCHTLLFTDYKEISAQMVTFMIYNAER